MSSTGFLSSLGVVGTMIEKVIAAWKKLDSSKQRLFIVVGVSGLLVAGALVWLLNTTQYEVLYTNLSASEAGEILAELENMKIDAKPSGSDTILVPKAEVDTIRMELAATGLPSSSTNLDILAKGSGFGLTEEDKAIYRRYQLQEDLQNAIKTFDCVTDARVSLYIPETSSFLVADQQKSATAAVLLTLKSGTSLSSTNILAISKLVEKSVSGLQPEGISIIDNNMNVLNADTSSTEVLAADQQVMEQQVSDRLKKQVMALLQPVFGVDKVLAEVNVALDFNESTIDSVKFEPNADSSTGIISTIDKIRESTNSNTNSGSTAAGTSANGTGTTTYPVASVDDQVYEKNSEAISYEINTIKEHLVKAKGTISKLSVSIILAADETSQADYTANVKKLVATAVGVSDEYITVEKLPFNGVAEQARTLSSYQAANDKALQWQRMKFFILLGAAVFILLVVFAGVLRFLRGKSRSKEDTDEERMLAAGTALQELQAASADLDDAGEARQPITLSMLTDPGSEEKQAVAACFDNHPELAASILRSWLAEDQR